MDFGYKGVFLLFSLFCATLLAGCVAGSTGGTDVTALASSLPQVKAFLDQYPNAKIAVALWDSAAVAANIDSIRADCGQQFAVADYYKVAVADPSLSLVVWLDKSGQNVMCAVKGATSLNATPTLSSNCPQYAPPAPGWCANGTIVTPKMDANGCYGPPTCVDAVPTNDSEMPPLPPEQTTESEAVEVPPMPPDSVAEAPASDEGMPPLPPS